MPTSRKRVARPRKERTVRVVNPSRSMRRRVKRRALDRVTLVEMVTWECGCQHVNVLDAYEKTLGDTVVCERCGSYGPVTDRVARRSGRQVKLLDLHVDLQMKTSNGRRRRAG